MADSPSSKQNSFCDERARVLADLRAMAAREYRWLLSNPENEDGRGFLGTLAWSIQHLDGLPEHWVAVDAPTRKPSDCLHEHASIICTDCGIDFRNARIRQDETTARPVNLIARLRRINAINDNPARYDHEIDKLTACGMFIASDEYCELLIGHEEHCGLLPGTPRSPVESTIEQAMREFEDGTGPLSPQNESEKL